MASSVRSTAVLTAGQAVALAATFLIPVVLARLFTPAEFGAYKQLFLVTLTLCSLLQLGLAESLYYFVPGQPQAAGRYVGNAILVLAFMGLGAFALVEAVAPWLARAFQNAELARLSGLVGALVLLMMMAAVLEIAMIARGRFGAAALTYAGSDLLRAACLVGPAALLGGLDGLMLGAVAFAALRLAGAVLYAQRALPGGLQVDGARLLEQFAYALPFGLAIVLEIVQRSLHQYAVSFTFDPATFAVYAVGVRQIPLVDTALASAGNVLMVQLATLRQAGQPAADALRAWSDTTRRNAVLTVGSVALLQVVAADLIVVLFTPTYAGSVPIFRVSCLALLLGTFMTDAVLRVHAETRFLIAVNAVRMVTMVGALVLLLPTLQLMGAALAPVLALAVGKMMALVRVRRLLGVSWGRVMPWSELAATAAAAGLAALLAHVAVTAVPLPALVRLGVAVTVFGLAYVALVVIALPRHERQALRTLLRWPARGLSLARRARMVSG